MPPDMEPAIVNRYTEAVERIAADKHHTFRLKAVALRGEITSAKCYTEIVERLTWVDNKPGDLFETYLRLRVRRCPRQP